MAMSAGPWFSLLTGGRTRCTPSWMSSGIIETADCKLYIPRMGKGIYDAGAGAEALAAGHLYLIPGQRRHRYHCPDVFDVDWIHVRLLDRHLSQLMAKQTGIRRWPVSEWRSWKPVYAGFADYFQAPSSAHELRIHAFLACLFAELVAEAPAVTLVTIPLWMDGVLAFLQQHFRRDPPLQEIARRAGITPVHLQRAFTTAVGTTPRLWMERRRMEEARRLLGERELTIAAVAQQCGYDDAFHFSRVFRRFHGRSPRQWLTQAQSTP